tara:strand:+ start:8661 stop:9002 length:342 start_codon:yes stop_codon:yes gene_type:complete
LLFNLSQLGFIAFPLLGILIPFIIWTSKKDKIKDVDQVGKSILNFQISWTLLLFFMSIGIVITYKLELATNIFFAGILLTFSAMYLMNFIVMIFNTLRYYNENLSNTNLHFPF